jgi:hypothetical protein
MNLGLSLSLGSRSGAGGAAPITGFVAGTQGSTTGLSTILTTPAEAQTGDCILMLGASNTGGNEVTPGAGWSTPVNTVGLSFAHRVHDGSASYTFTVGSSILHSVLIIFIRGYNFGIAGAAFSAGVTDPVANSITVAVANSININLVASAGGGVAWSMPAGWTARTATSAGRSIASFTRDALVGAGALAGVTATRTAGASGGRAIQVALSPV